MDSLGKGDPPLQRPAQPSEVAPMCSSRMRALHGLTRTDVFLAGPEGSYVTATVMRARSPLRVSI